MSYHLLYELRAAHRREQLLAEAAHDRLVDEALAATDPTHERASVTLADRLSAYVGRRRLSVGRQ